MNNTTIKSVKTMNRQVLPWTAKTLVNSVAKGKASFDNAVQRSLVWDNDRKSLLVHSMIIGAPIPPMYAAKNSEGVYDFLDGKQRSNAIVEYASDQFVLTNVPEIEYDDDTTEDINNYAFSELPEEMRDAILSYSLSINVFDDLTDDQISDIFFRLNNGKPLSSIEITRVRAKSLEDIQRIAAHPIFEDALTEKAFTRYAHEDIVIKSYIVLYADQPCLDTKFVRPYTESMVITDKQSRQMMKIYDTMKKVHKKLEDKDTKEAKKIAKKMLVRTHFISLVPAFREMVKEKKMNCDDITEFLIYFFSGKRGMSVSKRYNDNCGAGVGHKEAVEGRLAGLKTEIENFIRDRELIAETQTEAEVDEVKVDETEVDAA